MRQCSFISFLYIPFIIYCIHKFDKYPPGKRKGVYFFIASYLFALSLNIYIPTGILYFLIIFAIFSMVFKLYSFKENLAFLVSKRGRTWFALSVGITALLSTPLIVLYLEKDEVIPTLRFIQKNDYHLSKIFASDIDEDFLDDEFVGSKKVSIPNRNLLGLILEPFRVPYIGRRGTVYGEITLYVGMLTLLFLFFSAFTVRKGYSYLFFVISGFSLLLFANFRDSIVTNLSFNQKILFTIFPFLKTSEVLQHFGLLFVFCLIILGALGFKEMEKRKMTGLIFLVITLTVYKFLYIAFLLLQPKYPALKNGTVICLLIVLAVMLPVVAFISYKQSYFSINEIKNFFRLSILRISLIVLFIDLLFFNLGMYVFLPGESGFISKMYSQTLKNAGVYSTSINERFDNFRRISVYGKSFYDTYIGNAFLGLEIYKKTKTAFPNIIVGSFLNYPIPRYDHFFMTPSFYDYCVNIELEKQAILSGLCTPILQFFPDEKVHFVKHKYDAVKEINGALPSKLINTLYIENEPEFQRERLSASVLFEKEHYLNYTLQDITSFINTAQKFYKKPDPNISVKNHNVNFVTLEITTDRAGFISFADGYSKHWKAFVDGVRVKLYKANINFKAVSIPPGTHSVTFRYDPTLYHYSLYAFAVGNLAFFCIVIIYYRK